MNTPKSAILFLRRAADACYAAGDDARAFGLYSDAAHSAAAMMGQLRKAVA